MLFLEFCILYFFNFLSIHFCKKIKSINFLKDQEEEGRKGGKGRGKESEGGREKRCCLISQSQREDLASQG